MIFDREHPRENPVVVAGLVGREVEQRVLGERLSDIRRGIGGLVIVRGAPGIGKTALLDRLAGNAPPDVKLWRAAADPFEADRPLGLLSDALRSSGSYGAQFEALCQPEPSARAPTLHKHYVVDGATVVLESACSNGPALLALDDLQWCDALTAMTLNRLARQRPMIGMLVVASLRGAPLSPEVARLVDLARGGAGEILDLRPLDAAEVAELASSTLGAAVSPELLRMLDRAGGNPFLLVELLGMMGRDGRITVEAGVAHVVRATADVDADFARQIDGLLRSLDPPAAEAVRTIALLGGRTSYADLATVLDLGEVDVADSVRSAVDVGLVDASDDHLKFRHDLLRHAVYEAMPYPARVAAHAAAMRALGRRGAPASSVVPHASVVVTHGDPSASDEAIGWLRAAAREVLPVAPDVAVRHLQLAVTAARDPVLLAQLQAELAESLAGAGRLVEAQALLDRLEGVADAAVLMRTRRTAAFRLRMLGRFGAARAILAPLADTVDRRTRASVMAELALLDLLVGDVEHSLATAAVAVDLARETSDRLSAALAEAVESRRAWREERLAAAVDQLSAAVARGLAEPDPLGAMVPPVLQLGVDLVCLDRWEQVERLRRTVVQRAAAGSSPWFAYAGHLVGLWYFESSGDWDEALTESEAGLESAADHDYGWGKLLLRSTAARICARRGDTAAARRWLAPAEQQASLAGDNFSRPLVGWTNGLILLAEGDPSAALQVLTEVEDQILDSLWWPRQPFVAADMAEAASALGRCAEAKAAAERARDLAGRVGAWTARAQAALAIALVTRRPREVEGARRVFREPVSVPLQAAMAEARLALSIGGALEDSNKVLRAAGVRPPLRTAEETATAPGRCQPIGEPPAGWDTLTPSERRVAELVAQGLSNPEIAARLYVSRNTIQTHLRHIYEKLGLRSRTELTAAYLRHTGNPGS